MNEQNDILIVKPAYREEWLIPGGVVEADESPHAACVREVREELGLDLPLGQLLCLAYYPALTPWREMMQFVFAGGMLSEEQIARVALAAEELAEFRFVDLQEAGKLLNPRLAHLVRVAIGALRDGGMVYLENGNEVAREKIHTGRDTGGTARQ